MRDAERRFAKCRMVKQHLDQSSGSKEYRIAMHARPRIL